MLIRVIGHTDSTGSDAINDPLSVDRAESVGNYLVDRGIRADRIETVGRGSNEPLASNDSAEGRAAEPSGRDLPARTGPGQEAGLSDPGLRGTRAPA